MAITNNISGGAAGSPAWTASARLARASVNGPTSNGGTAITPQANITMACWVRWAVTTTTGENYTMGYVANGTVAGTFLGRVDGTVNNTATETICFRENNSQTQLDFARLTASYGSTTAWVHTCMTYDGTTLRTYVNGVATGSIASAPNRVASTVTTCTIGLAPGQNEMTDAVYFARALTAAEVLVLSKLRYSPMSLAQGDCFGYYPLFSGTSASTGGVTGTVGIDHSGCGNDLSLSSAGSTGVSSTGSPPILRGPNRPIYILPNPPTIITPSSTVTTGSATVGFSLAETAAGSTITTGAAAVALALAEAASSSTVTTGAATVGKGFAQTGTSSTITTGAATATATTLIPSSSSTRTFGTADTSGTFPISPSSSTLTTGAATVAQSVPMAASSSTRTTGAATASASVAESASSSTLTFGTAAFSTTFLGQGSGLTVTFGTADVSTTGGGGGGGGYVIPLPYSLGRTRQLAQGRPQRRRSR